METYTKKSSKNESKLKYEDIYRYDKGEYSLQGLKYRGNPIDDGLYRLSKAILDKPKYRKLFLKNSFKELIFKKIRDKIKNIGELQDMELESDVVRWLTVYKWFLRKRIPFIRDFDEVTDFIFDGIPFLQEWNMSIDLLCNELKDEKNKENHIDYIKALRKCKDMGLLNKKFSAVFCCSYNAHIVYNSKKNFTETGCIHEDCDGSYVEGCICEIDKDFIEFWFKDKGTTFELWFYYVLINYFYNCLKKNYLIFRRMEVYYNKSSSPITEIDVLAAVDDRVIAGECKNTKSVNMEMILKFYGVMNMLGINYGVFACTSKYNENIIPKNEVFNKYGIVIIDNLMHKPKEYIFKELDKIFEKL